MGCPGRHSLSIYARFSGKKRTSLYIFREKADHSYIHIKHGTAITFFPITIFLTAAWLAQLGERRSAEREVAGSNCRSNTQGL